MIRLARTIADLKGEDLIGNESLSKAMELRKLKADPRNDRDMLTGEKNDWKYR
jgi:predicted ATPase with chaperone activity